MKITACKLSFLTAELAVSVTLTSAALHESQTLNKIFDDIAASEYDIRWREEAGEMKAANRAQNLRFTIYDNGFAAEPRIKSEGALWNFEITLQGFGKDRKDLSSPIGGEWVVDLNNATSRAKDISTEYINTAEGIRQNFIVFRKLPGNGHLALDFLVRTEGLDFQVTENERALTFYNSADEAVVDYRDLRVFDAEHRELDARMVMTGPTEFSIVVDDSEATYPILIDPITTTRLPYQESQSGAKFGFSVALYLNVEDDTDYPGVIIGAPYYDTESYANAGKVFVYYAATDLPNSPTWTKEGDQADGHFGWSVADAGDVFDDFYSDVLIGAPDYDSGGYTDNGKAYLFDADSGGISSGASWTYTVNQSGAKFGYSVSSIDDFDLSDEDDFVVGAPYYDYYSGNEGMVLVFTGGASNPSYFETHVGSAGSLLGYCVDNAGDIEGNGYPDWLAGMPEYATGGSAKGGVKVFRSVGSGFNTTTLTGVNAGDKFGFSVAGVGDVDGDAYLDLAVGAPYHDDGQTDEGKVYIFQGTSTGVNTTAFAELSKNQADAHFGWTVGGHPENNLSNGDLYADFVIGAPDWDSTGLSLTDNGAAFLWYGDDTAPADSGFSVVGIYSNNHTGYAVDFGITVYRTDGFAVSTPDYSGTGYTGGSVSFYHEY